MTQIDKYETYRAIACLIIGITAIISMGLFGTLIEDDTLACIIMCSIAFIGGF